MRPQNNIIVYIIVIFIIINVIGSAQINKLHNIYATNKIESKNYLPIDGPIEKINASLISPTSTCLADNELSFDFDNAQDYTQEEINAIRQIVMGEGPYKIGLYDCIKKVFGNPMFSTTIKFDKIKRIDEPQHFNPNSNTISLSNDTADPNELFLKLQTLGHEIIHAFSDDLIKPFDNFEEGFAVAQTDLAAKLFCDGNGIKGTIAGVFNGAPHWTKEYNLYNNDALSPPLGEFWNKKGVINTSLRYQMAGVAAWKLWRETSNSLIALPDPNTYSNTTFFKEFNRLLFERVSSNKTPIPHSKTSFNLLVEMSKEAIRNCTGSELVEGQPFDMWWKNQYIFSYDIKPGTYLYAVNPYDLLKRQSENYSCKLEFLNLFERDSNGSEIELEGKLLAEIIALHNQGGITYNQDVTDLVSYLLPNEGLKKFNINKNISIFNFSTNTLDGKSELLFDNLPKGGYKIILTGMHNNESKTATRILYFANKIDPVINSCVGVIETFPMPGDIIEYSNGKNEKKQSDLISASGLLLMEIEPFGRAVFTLKNALTQNIKLKMGQSFGSDYHIVNIIQNGEASKLKPPSQLTQKNVDGTNIIWGNKSINNQVLLYAMSEENFSRLESEVTYSDFNGVKKSVQSYFSQEILMQNQIGRIELANLESGNYKWRMRLVSIDGRKSPWVYPACKEYANPEFIIIEQSVIDRIEIWPNNNLIVGKGVSMLFTANAFDKSNSIVKAKFDWSCSEGTITQQGVYTAPYKSGTYDIMVISLGKTASAKITVISREIEHIVITPASSMVYKGNRIQFQAQAYDIDGTLIPGVTFEWSTEPSVYGEINNEGLFTAGNIAGTCVIKARCGSKTNLSVVTITN